MERLQLEVPVRDGRIQLTQDSPDIICALLPIYKDDTSPILFTLDITIKNDKAQIEISIDADDFIEKVREEERSDAYEAAYSAAYDDGYDVGYDEGHTASKEEDDNNSENKEIDLLNKILSEITSLKLVIDDGK